MAYQGASIPIPCGDGGFDGNTNVYRIPITNLIRAKNLNYRGDSWGKITGAALFDATPVTGSPTLLGAFDWHPSTTVQRIISAWTDGKVYKEVGGDVDSVTLQSGYTFSEPVLFLEGGQEVFANPRKLFIYSEGQIPRFLSGDGATLSSFSNPPADWSGSNQPGGAVMHEGRIFAWMKHTVYVSTLIDHSDFNTGEPPIFEIMPGESEFINAAISMPGATSTAGSLLYLSKFPRGIYRLDTSDIFSLISPLDKINSDIAIAGPNAWCRVGNDIWFVSTNGSIHSLQALEAAPNDLKDSDITALLNMEQWIKDNVDLNRIKFARAIYDEINKEVRFCFTAKDETRNGTCLVIDISRPSQPRVAMDERSTIWEASFLYREATGLQNIYSGGTGGFIYKNNQASRNLNNTAYLGDFEYPSTDFGFADPQIAQLEKRFDWLEVTITPTGSFNISFDLFIDGRFSQTVQMSLGNTGAALGSFILGTSRLGGQSIINHKARIFGHGRRLSIRGYNSALNQDFSISEITVHLKPLGTKGSQ